MGKENMAMDLKYRIYFIVAYLVVSVLTKDILRPVDLSEESWVDMLEGEWVIKFYAPWCPACQDMTKSWDNVAKWSKDLDITVGKIDVTENPALSGRFLVMALPTIYHVKDGIFRLYKGSRSENAIISYIDDKLYESEEPVPWYSAPNTPHMTAVAHLFRVAMVIRNLHTTMTEEYGIPTWAIYVIFALMTIFSGLILGLLLVCFCDHFNPPAPYELPKKYSELPKEKHRVTEDNTLEKDIQDNESDIIDDREHADGVRKRNAMKE